MSILSHISDIHAQCPTLDFTAIINMASQKSGYLSFNESVSDADLQSGLLKLKTFLPKMDYVQVPQSSGYYEGKYV